MLDLTRVGELLGSILGPASAATEAGPDALTEVIAASGIDLQSLQNLTEGEIMQVLEQHGIDPLSIADGQIAQLLSELGVTQIDAGGLGDILGGFTDGSRS